MAIEEECAPDAALMESMRAVGYSLPTAVADIIDNSISASAQNVEVRFSGTDVPVITIFDDGTGMSGETLRLAMQLAGHGQRQRSSTDLGRFGLGLKTASLSQCRCLTVVSKQDGVTRAVSWDLDALKKTQRWSLLVLSDSEIASLPNVARLESVKNGTLVVWTKMDRYKDSNQSTAGRLDAEMVEVDEHLGLVFHQFLSGDAPYPSVAISINGRPVEPADPFLRSASRTQRSPSQPIDVAGVKIQIQAFTLPYLNKMTEAERRRAGVRKGLRDTQGFYIYRGGRLVVWGTWFRLMPRADSSKLTRVKVDVPNSLDYMWSLDIKKSAAVPPYALRSQLRNLAQTMIEPSEKVHRFRGRKPKGDDELSRLWDVIEDRDAFRYEINRGHPLVSEVQRGLSRNQLNLLGSLLSAVETTFPAQDLHNRMGSDQALQGAQADEEELFETAGQLWLTLGNGQDLHAFAQMLVTFEPWDVFRDRLPEFTQGLKGEMKDGHHE